MELNSTCAQLLPGRVTILLAVFTLIRRFPPTILTWLVTCVVVPTPRAIRTMAVLRVRAILPSKLNIDDRISTLKVSAGLLVNMTLGPRTRSNVTVKCRRTLLSSRNGQDRRTCLFLAKRMSRNTRSM